MVGWAFFAGVLVAVAATPRVITAVQPDLLLDPGIVVKALPALVCALLLALVFLVGLVTARPALLVLGGVGVTAVLIGYGAWLANDWVDRTEDFRPVAALVRRHAPDGEFRVFTRAKLLPLDFYYGRELPRLDTVEQLRDYLANTPRATMLIDAQNLKVTPAELRDQLRTLETLRIHEQRLFVLGCGADRGSPCAASPQ